MPIVNRNTRTTKTNMSKDTIAGFKGFNPDFTCRHFNFEVGQKYTHKGEISLCHTGFHFCENALDVLYYYPPTGKFAEVEGEEVDPKTDSDSKRVAKTITIKAELTLHALIQFGVKFILSKVDFKNAPATNTGYRSAATVEGKESIAIVTGCDSKASGALGCWIVLTERDSDWKIMEVKAFKVDGKKIKAGVFYSLIKGKAVKA